MSQLIDFFEENAAAHDFTDCELVVTCETKTGRKAGACICSIHTQLARSPL